MKNNIKWIFFDIGGVLRDETEYYAWQKNRLLEISQGLNPEITEEDFLRARLIASAMPGWLNANILEVLIGNSGKAEEMSQSFEVNKQAVVNYLLVRPDAFDVLNKLYGKYNLNIISNEQPTIFAWLKQNKLFDFFNIIGIPNVYKLQKPNPEFFKAVLKDAGAEFENSAMIDDNIERALSPAKELGMTTIYFNVDDRRDIPQDIVDFTIYSLTDLLNIF